jgi:GNAT superfamily N-acetyltransferase
MISIVPYTSEYKQAFYDLNVAWLKEFFFVEALDHKVLSNPEEYILDPGGHIFFAVEEGIPVGTVALLSTKEGVFELTKMAVLSEAQGKKIGQQLMQRCIDFALEHDCEKLILYSNTKLENAIYIYRKYGFVEIEQEKEVPYERSNIKMELVFS